MKLEWHLVILCSFLFNCWQGLSRWTSRLCAHKGKIFIWKMANNAQNYVGEVLPAKFLSETCSVNMRWSLRRRIGILCLYFPLNKSTKIPTNFTMHHARNQKKSIRRRTFYPPNIFIKIFVAQFGLPICGASVLMQRLAERLTSPIPGLGGFSQGSWFFPKK